MKKISLLLVLLLCLCGCAQEDGKKQANPDERYMDLIEIIDEHDNYQISSEYFDIACDMARIEGGYRFYVTIDNPKKALYDIEAIAIEKDVDYRNVMAANVGIFEDSEYNMIPYQSNAEKGYVKGLVMSGTTTHSSTTLYILVQWKDSELSNVSRELFKIDVAYGAN